MKEWICFEAHGLRKWSADKKTDVINGSRLQQKAVHDSCGKRSRLSKIWQIVIAMGGLTAENVSFRLWTSWDLASGRNQLDKIQECNFCYWV